MAYFVLIGLDAEISAQESQVNQIALAGVRAPDWSRWRERDVSKQWSGVREIGSEAKGERQKQAEFSLILSVEGLTQMSQGLGLDAAI